MRNERVPMPTRCIDCSTVSAIARMPVPRAATDGIRQSCCNRSVKLRACLSTYRSNFVKINPCYPWLRSLKQNIPRLLLAPLKSGTDQILRERPLKLLAHTRLFITSMLHVTLHQSGPICRNGNRPNTRARKRLLDSFRKLMHTRRIYLPRCRQSITRQTEPLIRSVIGAVKIVEIRLHDSAKPVEIEMRVARQHRIPRPLNQLPALAQGALALRPFQTRADTLVLIVLRDCHHVRVSKYLVVAANSGKMMNKTDHASGYEGAQGPATGLARDDQMPAR